MGRMSLWPAVVVAILYQNAAVLYLNVDVAVLANFNGQQIMVVLVQQAGNLASTREGVFFCTFVDFLVAPKSP